MDGTDFMGQLLARDNPQVESTCMFTNQATELDHLRRLSRPPKNDEEAEEQRDWNRSSVQPACPVVEHIFMNEATLRANETYHTQVGSRKKKPKKAKKKNPQRKLTAFIPKLKPKKDTPAATPRVAKKKKSKEKNHQGFSMDSCVFIKATGKAHYVPPKYFKEFYTESNLEEEGEECWNDGDFCEDCQLNPCVIRVRSGAAMLAMDQKKVHIKNWDDPQELAAASATNRTIMEGAFTDIIGKVFTKGYASRTPLPPCVLKHLDSEFPENPQENILYADPDSSSEEEEF